MIDPRINAALLLTHVPIGTSQMNYTFQIKTSRGTGTCFLANDDNGFFFVTAAHIVEGTLKGDTIYLAHKDGWISQCIREIRKSPSGYDIAAFTTEMKVVGVIPKFLDPPGLMPGQPMAFLGFPHGLQTNYPNANGYLSPLVRTAYFSGVVEINGLRMLILDGFNNPGYSGAPVYTTNDQGDAQLFAVISGFKFENPDLGSVHKRTEDGVTKLPDLFVNLNSGMIY